MNRASIGSFVEQADWSFTRLLATRQHNSSFTSLTVSCFVPSQNANTRFGSHLVRYRYLTINILRRTVFVHVVCMSNVTRKPTFRQNLRRPVRQKISFGQQASFVVVFSTLTILECDERVPSIIVVVVVLVIHVASFTRLSSPRAGSRLSFKHCLC